jgi:tRNA(Ile)-lysidine synthase
MPLVAGDWPGAIPALARFAELSVDDETFLTDTARDVLPAVVVSRPDGVQQIDVRGLNQLPAALSRRMIRAALEEAGGRPGFGDIEAVRLLARSSRSQAHLDLNGLAVEKLGWSLKFGAAASAGGDAPFEYRLEVPGSVEVPETGATIAASIQRGAGGDIPGQPVVSAVLQAEAIALPLTVRNRRPGDRLRPLGAPGSRKLQDLFVDRKVPRGDRDRVPLVVDEKGRIVWVIGHAVADDCRVTSPESGMVILQVKKGNQ